MRIEGGKQELVTNAGLTERINARVADLRDPQLAGPLIAKWQQELVEYDRIKAKLFEPDEEGNVKPLSVDQVFVMMLAKITEEAKVNVAVDNVDPLVQVLLDEIPKIEQRQKEVRKRIADDEAEASKKITSDDMKDGFSKTVRFYSCLVLCCWFIRCFNSDGESKSQTTCFSCSFIFAV